MAITKYYNIHGVFPGDELVADSKLDGWQPIFAKFAAANDCQCEFVCTNRGQTGRYIRLVMKSGLKPFVLFEVESDNDKYAQQAEVDELKSDLLGDGWALQSRHVGRSNVLLVNRPLNKKIENDGLENVSVRSMSRDEMIDFVTYYSTN